MNRVKDIFINNYNSGNMKKNNELLKNSFREYFLKNKYILHSPAPLISQEDKSVVFTSSSINILKPTILSVNYINEGYVLSQECLRTQALKNAFDNNFLPFGQAYFNISGILSRPDRFSKVFEEMLDFTINYLGIDPLNLKIKSTKKMDLLDRVEDFFDIDVEYDLEKEDFYKWRFGMEEIYGEGLTISIRNDSEDSYLDVGNIVRILAPNGKELGVEFGYGHEFFLSKVLGVKNPLELSEVFEVFPFREGLSSKYYGNLEVVSRIKDAKRGVRVNSSAKRSYKKYLQSLKFMGKSLDKDSDEIINEIQFFYNHISNSKDNFDLEERILNK